MTASSAFYDHVVEITQPYLGPSAKRFIDRQIINHLDIEPVDLTRKDMSRLVDWVSVAMSFLTDDRQLVDEYISELNKLGYSKTVSKKDTSR